MNNKLQQGTPDPRLQTPDQRKIPVGNLRLAYLDWGNETAPPLVAVHGAYQQAHSWDLVAPALAGDYHVMALDLRGHGESDRGPASEYRLETYLADLLGFLDALGLEQ